LALSKWNSYLKENNTELTELKQSSPVQNIIDYFSAPNLLDTFTLGGDFNYTSFELNSFTKNLILLNDTSVCDIKSWDLIFKPSLLDYRSIVTSN
jgi:hypothetical protein